MSNKLTDEIRARLAERGPMTKRQLLSACPSAKTMQMIGIGIHHLSRSGEVEEGDGDRWQLTGAGSAEAGRNRESAGAAAPPTSAAPAAKAPPAASGAAGPALPPAAPTSTASADAGQAQPPAPPESTASGHGGAAKFGTLQAEWRHADGARVSVVQASDDPVADHLRHAASHARDALDAYIEDSGDTRLTALWGLVRDTADALEVYAAVEQVRAA